MRSEEIKISNDGKNERAKERGEPLWMRESNGDTGELGS